jgi:hypothetical protein
VIRGVINDIGINYQKPQRREFFYIYQSGLATHQSQPERKSKRKYRGGVRGAKSPLTLFFTFF